MSYGKQLGEWAATEAGVEEMPAVAEDDFSDLPPGAEAITVQDMLDRDDLPPDVRAWLEEFAQRGPEWAVAHNPPSWVKDEALWEKAKRAAEHATGDATNYAFVTWWYLEHGG